MSARKVNQAEFAKLYSSGVPMKEIMVRFGVLSKTTLQENRKQMGLKARPWGAPKKRKSLSHAKKQKAQAQVESDRNQSQKA